MSIQLAGFAGSNVFQSTDAPRYTHGLVICGACTAAAGVVVLVWKVLYRLEDRRAVSVREELPVSVSVVVGCGITVPLLPFHFTQVILLPTPFSPYIIHYHFDFDFPHLPFLLKEGRRAEERRSSS